MTEKLNPQVEAVIAESTAPELVRALIVALEAGELNEAQQMAAMEVLTLYEVDLFDLGVALLSDKSQEEIERLAAESGQRDREERPDAKS